MRIAAAQSASQSAAAALPRYVDETRAAEILGLAVKTLRRWRLFGRGPRFRKMGAAVRYDIADIVAWVEAQPSGGGGA